MGELCFSCFQEKAHSGVCEHCGFDPAVQEKKYPLALPLGTILNGRYIIGRVLGQGGFGVTYLAQDFQTKQRVAIKEYFPSELSTRSGSYRVVPYSGQREQDFEFGKKKFMQEAQTLAEFNSNPYIANIYLYFEEESTQTAYFVMEYVSEVSLESYVKSKGGRLSPEETGRILIPMMYALDEVHKQNIVHRDIAPDNILLTADLQPKLIDFGAARSSTGNKSMSMDVVVKHGFAPREQYSRQGRIGPYTDVYSMGATWYYAITGRIPPESIDRGEDDGLIMPGVLGVKLPEKQLNGLLKALAVRAEDRFQSMAEFAAAMEPETIVRTQPEHLVTRAFSFLEQGDWAKAESYLNTAADFEPENPMVYVGLLMAKRQVSQQQDLQNAGVLDSDPYFQKALELADSDLRIQLETWASAARGKAQRESLDALMKEGRAALKGGKWDAADERFQQALQLDPSNVEAHLGLLLAESKVKDIPQLVKSKTPLEGSIHYAAVMAGGDSVLREQLEAVQRRKAELEKRKSKKWFFPALGVVLAIALALYFFRPEPKPKPVKEELAAPVIVMPTFEVPAVSAESDAEPAEQTAQTGSEQTTAPNGETALPAITIRAADNSKVYDGTELRANEYLVEGKLNGFRIDNVVIEGSLTEAGTGTAKIASFELYYPDGTQVPEDAIRASGTITIEDGTLSVEKRKLTVTAVTADLSTDGQTIQASEINENGFTSGFAADGLAENQSLQGNFVLGSGARSFVTRIDTSNITVVDGAGKDVTACYDIRAIPGKVTITVPPLRVSISEDCTELSLYYQAKTSYDQIRFAVWSEVDGQDDLHWYDAEKTGQNSWAYTLDLRNHRSAGIYHAHVYAREGDESIILDTRDFEVESAINPTNYIVAERTAFIGNAAKVVLNSNETYTSVKFAVWTDEDGQDDLQWYEGEMDQSGQWYCTFKPSDHPGVLFYIHCYGVLNGEETIIDGITRYWD